MLVDCFEQELEIGDIFLFSGYTSLHLCILSKFDKETIWFDVINKYKNKIIESSWCRDNDLSFKERSFKMINFEFFLNKELFKHAFEISERNKVEIIY